MSNDNKEAKKEELLEKQEARQLTEEELEQVTGGKNGTGKQIAIILDGTEYIAPGISDR